MKGWRLALLLILLMPMRQAWCAHNGRVSTRTKRTSPIMLHGIASWYGGADQGHIMASGEPFDQHALTAATHRTLPLGTKVRVTNLRNGRSVTVRVMDRLPSTSGRLIDLSEAAAAQLGFIRRGLTVVNVLVVSLPRNKTACNSLRAHCQRA